MASPEDTDDTHRTAYELRGTMLDQLTSPGHEMFWAGEVQSRFGQTEWEFKQFTKHLSDPSLDRRSRAWDRFSLAMNTRETAQTCVAAALAALRGFNAEVHDAELAQWIDRAHRLEVEFLSMSGELYSIAGRLEDAAAAADAQDADHAE